MPSRNPAFSDEGWYWFREIMFWFFVLTIALLNGTLQAMDKFDGTHNAFSNWLCLFVIAMLRISLFWDELKEKLL